MIGPDAQPRGVNAVVENPTSLEMSHRRVDAAPPGKTMFQTVNNSMEEFGSFLHKHQNLNRQRARESRRDLNSLDVRRLTRSALSAQQVEKVEEMVLHVKSKHFDKKALLQNIEAFRHAISEDITQQTIGLLALKEKINSSDFDRETHTGVPKKDVSEIIELIDNQLKPAETSQEFAAATLGFSIVEWAADQGIAEREALSTHFQASYPISFKDMSHALTGLRQKFGDKKIEFGTQAIFKQLSAQYHAEGQNISKAQLFELMKNMSQLKTLMGLFDECRELSKLIASPGGNSEGMTVRLLNEIAVIQDKTWVEQSDIGQLMQNLGLKGASMQATVSVQLKRIVGLIPDFMYQEPAQKQQSLEALFQFIDMTSRREASHA
ncbi:TyeA family type III secretion system gatekeeper subunit [Marinibactrum halimedae]|uniref:Type III secretion system effector delivery regulator TyeA domain-containing protein n=1 Tax=Marinibactrum halimedae TaxID=1444977 RepID=A0AA37WM88_9GAMM|nr:TyeA family type III secretion system gatekeeper subunit [Marinibactrum halimedae]MCD9459065.1 TyeA family type III secretion system gatekeeper subunit [Marinibactrum halimedae]GLS24666.1 hypothetical protein GCM10007877_03800 [Marinibactrum halimedae]